MLMRFHWGLAAGHTYTHQQPCTDVAVIWDNSNPSAGGDIPTDQMTAEEDLVTPGSGTDGSGSESDDEDYEPSDEDEDQSSDEDDNEEWLDLDDMYGQEDSDDDLYEG
jgi:hypothetical protein